MDIKQIRLELFIKLANDIKELGYKVFIRYNDWGQHYGWIVNDKDEIGYFQFDDFRCGITFSTVHKPCYEFGSGFSLDNWDEGHRTFTREIVDRCFIHHPRWARGKLSQIRKYTATEYFAKYWDKENVIKL